MKVAIEAFASGYAFDSYNIVKAFEAWFIGGQSNTTCFFAFSCMTINMSFNKEMLHPLSEIGDGKAYLGARTFFRRNWCMIHQAIIKGEWEKFKNSVNLFLPGEQKMLFDEREDKCRNCAHAAQKYQTSLAFAYDIWTSDRRFYDYLWNILYRSELGSPTFSE